MPVATFPCTSCGAELEFKPGTTSLQCASCGSLNEIPKDAEPVEELDYRAMLADLDEKADHVDAPAVHCDSCGANVTLEQNVTSQSCPFCGSHIVATEKSVRVIKPRSLIPFRIDRQKARTSFRSWLGGLWFAPNALKSAAFVEGDAKVKHGSGLAGVYLPHWTFDCAVHTTYTGQRGDDYFVSVPMTVMVNGKPTVRMVQQRRTRWRWVSGSVSNSFDDVLVTATHSLPPSRIREIGDWNTKELIPFRPDYLAGFRAESYTLGLPEGFSAAQGIMRHTIEMTIRRDIGGDHQRIASLSPTYTNVTFKHILLPVWVSAYRYNGRVFRFLINGATGRLSGERPYSPWKISFAVLAGLVLAGIVAILIARG